MKRRSMNIPTMVNTGSKTEIKSVNQKSVLDVNMAAQIKTPIIPPETTLPDTTLRSIKKPQTAKKMRALHTRDVDFRANTPHTPVSIKS